jgi:hypothetical protein
VNEKTMKARVAGNRLLATFALIGALACVHYAFARSGWQGLLAGVGTGLLSSVTITRTLKASVQAAGLMFIDVYVELNKKENIVR